MKNILLIMGLLYALLAMAQIDTTTCKEFGGKAITANDNKIYCKSNMGINWWSANAWCQSLGPGVELINIKDVCTNDYAQTMSCDNLKGTGTDQVWTKNIRDSEHVYYIYLNTGTIETNDNWRGTKSWVSK